jgi:hypothetical protein
MKAFGMVLLCLALGACASFLAMLFLTTPEHRGGGSWDYSPILGLVYGAPTWLVSFPIIYFLLRSRAQEVASAFIFASVGSFVLTIAVPFTLHRLSTP